jgi:hypothetical protein
MDDSSPYRSCVTKYKRNGYTAVKYYDHQPSINHEAILILVVGFYYHDMTARFHHQQPLIAAEKCPPLRKAPIAPESSLSAQAHLLDPREPNWSQSSALKTTGRDAAPRPPPMLAVLCRTGEHGTGEGEGSGLPSLVAANRGPAGQVAGYLIPRSLFLSCPTWPVACCRVP